MVKRQEPVIFLGQSIQPGSRSRKDNTFLTTPTKIMPLLGSIIHQWRRQLLLHVTSYQMERWSSSTIISFLKNVLPWNLHTEKSKKKNEIIERMRNNWMDSQLMHLDFFAERIITETHRGWKMLCNTFFKGYDMCGQCHAVGLDLIYQGTCWEG